MSADFKPRPDDQAEKPGEGYSFVQETIKGDQMNGRKALRKGFRVVCYGFLFGIALCLGFYVFSPFADNFRNSSSGQVSFVKDDQNESTQEQGSKAEGDSGKQEEETEEEESLDLNADNYKAIYRKLKDVKSSVEASLVTVRGYLNKDDKTSSVEVYGCVLSKNSSQILLMAYSDNLSAMKQIEAEFYGGQTETATIRKNYEVLHLAVLEVDAAELSETTQRIVKPANLGTSAGVKSGDPVLALGDIYGFPHSVGYGTILDVSGTIQREDGTYYRMKTDIQGARSGNGVLVNLQGDVIGIVSPIAVDEDERVSGIGISSVKSVLEFLLNGRNVPYTGLIGTEVTKEAAEEEELPSGVYVQNVSADSPAMEAGIKNGDIIIDVNGEEVDTMESYHRALMKCIPGSRIFIGGKRRSNDGYADMKFKVVLR